MTPLTLGANIQGRHQFFRFKSLGKKIRIAARHNLREFLPAVDSSNIDIHRSSQNQILIGHPSAADVYAEFKRLINEAKIGKIRKNAVCGIEFIFSIPLASTIESVAFFEDCLRWLERPFPAPIVSAVIHRDEGVPHMHVIMIPLVESELQGSKIMGDRAHVKRLQTSFYNEVGSKYGMSRPKPKKRIGAALRHKAAELGFNAIIDNPELLIRPDVESVVLASIAINPEPLLHCLGLQMPQEEVKPRRTFVEIMTKPCKPESKVSDAFSNNLKNL